ncbi:hypothetical protein FYJ77_05060 [Schaalia hyovaginalis]|nr:hypothetical protein [Schaalia hyovaginalis]
MLHNLVVASYFHDSTAAIEFEDLEEALTSGHRAGEVRTYARKREFNTSPSGGDGGTLQIADFGRFSDWHDRADFFTFRWNCAEFLLHTIAHRVPPNARISLGDVARR